MKVGEIRRHASGCVSLVERERASWGEWSGLGGEFEGARARVEPRRHRLSDGDGERGSSYRDRHRDASYGGGVSVGVSLARSLFKNVCVAPVARQRSATACDVNREETRAATRRQRPTVAWATEHRDCEKCTWSFRFRTIFLLIIL
jgi:hypothetical protein